jgi:hypothetical protein
MLFAGHRRMRYLRIFLTLRQILRVKKILCLLEDKTSDENSYCKAHAGFFFKPAKTCQTIFIAVK